ncbi:MAG: prepilin-type N-terminal cleavage/methylation domain-containing protein [Patescibacteria group bacterium]
MKLQNNGFTLLELLVVLTIIGMLASIVIASISEAREKGRIAKAQAELNQLSIAMELLFNDTGYYPSGEPNVTTVCARTIATNEIRASYPRAGLVSNGQSWTTWNGPYIRIGDDPWGTPYFFDSDYECSPEVLGCNGINDNGQLISSVIISCGPNRDLTGSDASGNLQCDSDSDNIVFRICRNDY